MIRLDLLNCDLLKGLTKDLLERQGLSIDECLERNYEIPQLL